MKLSLRIKSFYEKRFGEERESVELAELRIRKILELIGSGKRILDVGCYDGGISLRLKKLGNEVVGVDISAKAVRLAKKRGVEAYVCNLEEEKNSCQIR